MQTIEYSAKLDSASGAPTDPGHASRKTVTLAIVAILACFVAVGMWRSLSPSVSFESQLTSSHVVLIVIALGLAALSFVHGAAMKRVLTNFFCAASRPLNLAIYRIVLFFTIWADLDHDANPEKVRFFSALPEGLQIPPPGLGTILHYIPISPWYATIALKGITIFSFCAMIGLFARTAAALTVVCMLYGLGIPQMYGQVNHYHHMLWFASILAASRCADVLSIDAFLGARRRADQDGLIAPPVEQSVAYTLPLRFVWIVLGMIYFFPGFWKYWRSGFDWALSDNFKYQLHLKWMQRGDGYLPIFRIDNYPILYMPAALGAMAWELSFLPSVFFRPTRVGVAFIGALFHASTRVLMHISFWTLQTSYIALFNWDGIFRNLGKRLYREPMLVLYDGQHAGVARRLAGWRTLDVFFGRINYIDVSDAVATKAAGIEPVDPASLEDGIQAVVAGEAFSGRTAWRAISLRIPPLWLVLPLIDLFTPRNGGARARRTGGLAWLGAGPVPRTAWAAGLVFGTLMCGNILFGAKENRTGYPFTCYPPFSRILGPETEVIHVEALDANNEVIPWDEDKVRHQFSSARYVSLIKYLRMSRDPKLMKAFWSVVQKSDPDHLKDVTVVNFWESTVLTDPKIRGGELVKRELVFKYPTSTVGLAISGRDVSTTAVNDDDDFTNEDPQ